MRPQQACSGVTAVADGSSKKPSLFDLCSSDYLSGFRSKNFPGNLFVVPLQGKILLPI